MGLFDKLKKKSAPINEEKKDDIQAPGWDAIENAAKEYIPIKITQSIMQL